jgi:crotonobetainyl-CoA:carnitine CoA-transferase CaiB-like acyl-CoA transferase
MKEARISSDGTARPPLEGIRVLELAEIWAAPFCAALLGDLGAEVIKVESIQRIARGPIRPGATASGYPDGDPGERPWNRQGAFNVVNRSKLGITLDLTRPSGVDAFSELAAVSDVLVCNYAYGVLDSFGFDYESLRRIRPDMIVVMMPGYGNTGPYKRYRSMGMTLDAISGHSALRGYPDLDLSRNSVVHHPDAVGAATAVFAICASLLQRARSGKGQLVDMSQAEAFMPHLGEAFLEHGMTGRTRERRGNRHPAMAPHGCYPCLDEDKWVTIAVRDEGEWRAFCEVVGAPGLVDDARFATLEGRLRHQDELDELVAQWTSSRDRYEVTRLLQARGVPAGPVLDCCGDTYDDPHLNERGYFQVVTHPEAGTYPLSGPIWRFPGSSEPTQLPAPSLGEHNGYVLGQVLGFPEDALAKLERENVIGDVPLEGADMGGVRRAARAR